MRLFGRFDTFVFARSERAVRLAMPTFDWCTGPRVLSRARGLELIGSVASLIRNRHYSFIRSDVRDHPVEGTEACGRRGDLTASQRPFDVLQTPGTGVQTLIRFPCADRFTSGANASWKEASRASGSLPVRHSAQARHWVFPIAAGNSGPRTSYYAVTEALVTRGRVAMMARCQRVHCLFPQCRLLSNSRECIGCMRGGQVATVGRPERKRTARGTRAVYDRR